VHEQIAANKRKTILLFVVAIAFTGLIGYAIGYIFWNGGTAGVVIAVVLAAVLSLSSYFAGDRLVLASTRAREVTAGEEPRLHNVVEGLAIAAGVPKPRVYVVPEQAPNAFATGRNPEHSSVAVTQGLLDIMNRVELEGVIGHEMSHVLDRDILIGTVVATVVGAAVLMSEFFMRSWFWSGGRMGRRDDGGGGNAGVVALVLFAVGIVLLIIAPIAGQLIKLSVSRNREYLADAQGVLLTRYPPGLIAALEKIRDAPHAMRAANNATAHLWLEQPSRVPGEGKGTMEKLFSTHPPIQDRIDRLRDM
jgi:heat shock protein HtpX